MQPGMGRGMRRRAANRITPRMGKPTVGIVSANRKTELCRNWKRGCCIYGASKCAFAHGEHELKYQTLDEMEHAGRIPNASKFRCYPCLTWVATGSCPYFARCVFIHDPRIRGPNDAWLYSSTHLKAGTTGSGGVGGCPFGRDGFYWPDMVRTDALGNKVPSISAHYDMHPGMLDSDDPADRAVYHLWYSLVGTLMDEKDEQSRATTISSVSPSGGLLSTARAPMAIVTTSSTNWNNITSAGNRALRAAAGLVGETFVAGRSGQQAAVIRPWRAKRESKRLALFVRMAKGQSVCPDYVSMPELGELGGGPTGLDSRCVCEQASLGGEPAPLGQAHGEIQNTSLENSEAGTLAYAARPNSETHSSKVFRIADREREEPTGTENHRPTMPLVRSDPLSRPFETSDEPGAFTMFGTISGTNRLDTARRALFGELGEVMNGRTAQPSGPENNGALQRTSGSLGRLGAISAGPSAVQIPGLSIRSSNTSPLTPPSTFESSTNSNGASPDGYSAYSIFTSYPFGSAFAEGM